MSQLHIKDGDSWRPLTPADLAAGPASTGLTDAQLRATPVAVSGGLTDAQMRASAVPIEPLGRPGIARQVAAGASSASVALTATVRRVSISARGADIRYAVGTGTVTAAADSHYIAQGDRLDILVPASAKIAAIRAGTVDGVLEVSELLA